MDKMKMLVVGTILLSAGLTSADVVTNVWSAAADVDWDTDAVWSLGHKP